MLLVDLYFIISIRKKPFPCQKSKVQNGSEENAEKPAIDPASPKVVVDIQTPKEKNNSLPPIEKPPLDVNKNEPLPSITRQ